MKGYINKIAPASLLLALALLLSGCKNTEDVGVYVQACLDYRYQKSAEKYCELTGISLSEAEEDSAELLEKSVLRARELNFSSDEKYTGFADACRKILKKADYQVGETQKKKAEKSSYLVNVTYHPLNVEETIGMEYDSALETESIPSDGETLYLGDVMTEVLDNTLETVEYGEAESMEICVKEQNGILAIEEDELGRLDEALFGITEVQDAD